ncbi:hypothetical protein VOLCADRAFT_104527 [Volvox carteri f. nagariensis]|uniref:Uncharacterized protein n=1 Tax=Volvox carteri f. nagariensis TaxID=3068 RepID=D8TU76_VOLCA|nr:uncharacterized protein VOLCADRAFT_104527 [Volvox carteri f. nagariensis]EFJ49097.1 hypothetical protein VOLCADRAFT_104527 [Volvox carteri f. nagariensis]|eukprot:XP_002949994.1 hypothetical protein VOLCADRAFT_104527 [Volvox carteri f. nagariensis]
MFIIWFLTLFVIGTLTSGVAASDHCNRHTRPNAMERIKQYGNYDFTHSIRTRNKEMVQPLFDLGFLLAAGYNQPESRRAFRQALEYDNLCAMCWWGVAYARVPFQNKFVRRPPHVDESADVSMYYRPVDADKASKAIQYAAALVGLAYLKDTEPLMTSIKNQMLEKPSMPVTDRLMNKLPRCSAVSTTTTTQQQQQSPLNETALLERERYYIAAMFDRLSVGIDMSDPAGGVRLWQEAERRYVADMTEIANCFPDDADAPALAAEALANLSPWMFVLNGTSEWRVLYVLCALYGDGAAQRVAEDQPTELAKNATRLLQVALERNPAQPLAMHLLIHVTEELPARNAANDTDYVAGLALDSANRLLNKFPTLDHLQHMPSHTFVRVGMWRKAIEAGMYEKAQVYARVLREISRFVPDNAAVVGPHWPAPLLVYTLFGNWSQVAVLNDLADRVNKSLLGEAAAGGGSSTTSDVFLDPALDPVVRDRVPAPPNRPALLTAMDYRRQPADGPQFAVAVWLYAQLMAVADKVHELQRLSKTDIMAAANINDIIAGMNGNSSSSSASVTVFLADQKLLEDLHATLKSVVAAIPPDGGSGGEEHGGAGGEEEEAGPGPGLGVLTPGYKLMANVMLKMAEARVSFIGLNFTSGFKALEQAVELEDSGGYNEPPRLAQQPVRQCLGWALMTIGNHTAKEQLLKAMQAFIDDLARNPNNPWSVMGLQQLKEKLPNSGLAENPDALLEALERVRDILSRVTMEPDAANAAVEKHLKSSCYAFGKLKLLPRPGGSITGSITPGTGTGGWGGGVGPGGRKEKTLFGRALAFFGSLAFSRVLLGD